MSEDHGNPEIRIVATCDHCGLAVPENTEQNTAQGLSSETCPECGQSTKNETEEENDSGKRYTTEQNPIADTSFIENADTGRTREESIQEWLDRELPQHYELDSVYFQCAEYLVVRVREKSLNRDLLLKVAKKPTAEEPEGSTELAEAELLASLHHPHLLTVYDTGFTREGRLYILMEDPGTKTLESVIQEEGFLDLDVALNLFRQYSDAIHSLHELSIVHGAVRPRSFSIIDLDDGVFLGKLTNCGITRCSEDNLKMPTKIGRNYTCIDAFYMSPEECNSLPQDMAGEIYSLGCVFFHSITGKPVFRARDLKEAVKQHMDESRARFRRQYEIKEDVQAVILKMLEKDAENRYKSVKEVEQAISVLLGEKRTDSNSIWQKIVARVIKGQNKNRF